MKNWRRKRKLKPVLAGEPWLVAGNPKSLGELQGAVSTAPFQGQEVVDHHIWRDAAGVWRCWACIRGTAVGRIFYSWESASLTAPSWKETGVAMRRSREHGESLNDRGRSKTGHEACSPGVTADQKEWLQSPFVVREGDTFFLFYGGGDADPCGSLYASSICLATSDDGFRFTRRGDACGRSRVFIGPGEARDPCVLKHEGTWYLYYSGAETGTIAPNKTYVRTSKDLFHWSASREVHWGGSVGAAAYECECPYVIHKEGFFYLFRTKNYATGSTYVYRSADPFDFGIDNDDCLICSIDVAAPEIITDGREEYVSSCKEMSKGIVLHRLRWESD